MPVAARDKNIINQRRWKRYELNNGAFVMLYRPPRLKLGKPSMVKLGPIKDIGMRGLAIQYVEQKNLFRNVEELSISLPNGTIVVDKIKFQIVKDFEVAELPNAKKIRTVCVNFPNLLPMQRVQLERFIDEYATRLGG